MLFYQFMIFKMTPPTPHTHFIYMNFLDMTFQLQMHIAILMKMENILLMSFFVHLPGPYLIFNYRSRIVCTLLLPKSRNIFFVEIPRIISHHIVLHMDK